MMKLRKSIDDEKTVWLRLHAGQNTTETGLLVVSHPGLSWQDTRSGDTSEQEKSLQLCKTDKGRQTLKKVEVQQWRQTGA
jgi:hypothetical protein